MNEIKHLLKNDLKRMKILMLIWLLFLVCSAALTIFTNNSYVIVYERISIFFIAILIPLLIFSEPTVGTTAFWFTRPINIQKLIFSKLLFILIFFIIIPRITDVSFAFKNNFSFEQFLLYIFSRTGSDLTLVFFIYCISLFCDSFFKYGVYLLVFMVLLALGIPFYNTYFLENNDIFQLNYYGNIAPVLSEISSYIIFIILIIKISFHRYKRKKILISILLFISGIVIVFILNAIFIFLSKNIITGNKYLKNINIIAGLQNISLDYDNEIRGSLSLYNNSDSNYFAENFRIKEIEFDVNASKKIIKNSEYNGEINEEKKIDLSEKIVKTISNQFQNYILINKENYYDDKKINMKIPDSEIDILNKNLKNLKVLVKSDIYELKKIFSAKINVPNEKIYYCEKIYKIKNFSDSGKYFEINIERYAVNTVLKNLFYSNSYKEYIFLLTNHKTKEILISEEPPIFAFDFMIFPYIFNSKNVNEPIELKFQKSPHQLLDNNWLSSCELVCIGFKKIGFTENFVSSNEKIYKVENADITMKNEVFPKDFTNINAKNLIKKINKNPDELKKYIEQVKIFAIEEEIKSAIESEITRIEKYITTLPTDMNGKDPIFIYSNNLIISAIKIKNSKLENKISNILMYLPLDYVMRFLKSLSEYNVDQRQYIQSLWVKYKNSEIENIIDFMPHAIANGNIEVLEHCINLYYNNKLIDKRIGLTVSSLLQRYLNIKETDNDLREWFNKNKNSIIFDKSIGKYILKMHKRNHNNISYPNTIKIIKNELPFQNGYSIIEIKNYKNKIAVSDAGGFISFWDKITEKCAGRIKISDFPIDKFCFITDSQILAFTSKNKKLKLIHFNTDYKITKEKNIADLSNIFISNLNFSENNGKIIFDFNRDLENLYLARVESELLIFESAINKKYDNRKKIFELKNLEEFPFDIKNIFFAYDEKYSGTAMFDGNFNKIIGFRPKDFNNIFLSDKSVNISNDNFPSKYLIFNYFQKTQFAISNNQKYFAALDHYNNLNCWEINTNKLLFKITTGPDKYNDFFFKCRIIFTPDDKNLVFIDSENILFFNIERKKLENAYKLNLIDGSIITGSFFDKEGDLFISDSKGSIRNIKNLKSKNFDFPANLIKENIDLRKIIFLKDDDSIEYYNSQTLKKIDSFSISKPNRIIDISSDLSNFLIKTKNKRSIYSKQMGTQIVQLTVSDCLSYFIHETQSVYFTESGINLLLKDKLVEVFNNKTAESQYGGYFDFLDWSSCGIYEQEHKFYNPMISYSKNAALITSNICKLFYIPFYRKEISVFDINDFLDNISFNKVCVMSGCGFINEELAYFTAQLRSRITEYDNEIIFGIYNFKSNSVQNIFSVGNIYEISNKLPVKISNNKKIAALFCDKKILFLDIENGVTISEIPNEFSYIKDGIFSGDDKSFYISYQNGMITVKNIFTKP